MVHADINAHHLMDVILKNTNVQMENVLRLYQNVPLIVTVHIINHSDVLIIYVLPHSLNVKVHLEIIRQIISSLLFHQLPHKPLHLLKMIPHQEDMLKSSFQHLHFLILFQLILKIKDYQNLRRLKMIIETLKSGMHLTHLYATNH